ncbi:hypothetical protein BSL78_18515, partial [Apostichopus japonicus]
MAVLTKKNPCGIWIVFITFLLWPSDFLITTSYANIPLVIEEGSDIHLNFSFTYDNFGLLRLLKDNEKILQIEDNDVTLDTRPNSIEFTPLTGFAKFTLINVDASDTGQYKCVLSGQLKDPVYNLTVISSTKEFTIRNYVRNVVYENNSVVSVVEDEPVTLSCKVVGGLWNRPSITWILDDAIKHLIDYRTNHTEFDEYYEETTMSISRAEANLDGLTITCTAREGKVYLYLSIKSKPTLTSPASLTEGIPVDMVCILNATTNSFPTFNWELDGYDVTANSTHRQNGGHKVFVSMFRFYPIRSYFAKELMCKIGNDENRFTSYSIEVKYPATITSLYATPSEFVAIHDNVNLSCAASGFPLPTLYWSKQQVGGNDIWLEVTTAIPGIPLNGTAASISILINDIQVADVCRYRCIASNRIGLDEKDINLIVEESGIIFNRSTILFEDIPVNITCVVKKTNAVDHVRWIIGHLDITRNATQNEYENERGDYFVRSILLFHPKMHFDGMLLTCNGGKDQRPVDPLLLKISHCKEISVHSCSVERNRSNARLACEIGEEVPVNEIGFFKYENQLEREFLTVIKSEHYTIISYDLGSRQDAFLVGYNCCTSTERCTQYCQVCEVNEYLTTEEEEQSFILYIVVAIAILFGVIFILVCTILRGRTRGSGNFIKSPDTIGVHTLQAVNSGPSIQSHLGSLPEIYEPMGTGYTTRVHPTSEFSRDDDFLSGDGITDNVSDITDLTEVTLMSNVGNKAMSLNEKLSKLYGLHAGLETLEKEYATSMERRHFVKEIGIVKTLDRHSNIADILGLCCDSKLNYILFEKMTGKTLKQHLLKTRESVSDLTAHNEILREYAEQICNGMLFLSNQGFCHPSLRCESVHVSKKGVCKLYDFTPVELCGVKDGYNQDSVAHELVAPEIVKGESHTTRTDVWAFGNLLWELFFYGLDASNMFENVGSKSYGQLIGSISKEKPIACPDA